jgi:hypothetical protein
MLGECEVGGDAGALSSAEIDETVAAAAHRSRRMLSHCHDTGMPTISIGIRPEWVTAAHDLAVDRRGVEGRDAVR